MARSRTGEGRDQYPLLQLWRPRGSGRYERVYESSSDRRNFMMSDVSGITPVEYLPNDPVSFHSGYILGVYQPGGDSNSRLSLIHVEVPTGLGRANYVRRTSLAVFNTSGAFVRNDEPLVAVNTSEKVVSIFLVHVFKHGSITLKCALVACCAVMFAFA